MLSLWWDTKLVFGMQFGQICSLKRLSWDVATDKGGGGLVGMALIPRTLKRCPLSLHTCNRLLKDFDVRSKRCAWKWMYDYSQRGIGCKNCVWCFGQKQTSRQARHLYQSFKLIGADKGGVYKIWCQFMTNSNTNIQNRFFLSKNFLGCPKCKILIHYVCNAHFHWLWRRKFAAF